MRFNKVYNILKVIIVSLFFAFFFIYLIGGIWLLPFNYLLPQHFDNFVATTVTGRLIERIGFLFCFISAIIYTHHIHHFRSLLPSPELNWITKVIIFIKLALITFICLLIIFLGSIYLGFIEINPEDNHSLLSNFSSNFYHIFFIGLIGHFLVALGEETVYRGLVFRYMLKETNNTNIALFLSSLIFSLFHFHYNAPLSFLLAFFGGYLLALIYYHSGTLLYCVSIHWSYNLFMHLFTPKSEDYLVNYVEINLHEIPGLGSYFSLVRIGAFILIILILMHSIKHKILKPSFPNR